MSESIEEKKERRKYGKRFWIMLGIVKVGIILLALLVFFISKNTETSSSFNFKHIHGLGYASNGNLYMPVHDGLAVYKQGNWSGPGKAGNDYMGFSIVKDGFYSSGHPGENTDLPNPLGVIKVTENGKNISKQSLAGVSDFHLMAAGYYSQAVYVINQEPNDLMKKKGLYYSLDKGKTWTYSAAKGLTGNITAIAAEPKKENVVAIGTDQGVFYSDNFGKTFEEYDKGKNVTALAYGFDHELLVATYDGKSSLNRLSPKKGGATLPVELSSVEREPIIFVAQNPKDTQEITIAAKNLDLFVTNNFGHNWVIITKNGRGLSGQ